MKFFTLSVASCRQNVANNIYPDVRTISNMKELADAVRYDHVPAVMEGNSRERVDGKPNARFRGADVIVLDCDNTHTDDPEGWKTPRDLQTMFPDVEFCISYSRNHNKEKGGKAARPRWHIYLPLRTPISDAEEIGRRKQQLQKMFPEFDSNALNALRLFFGVENPQVEEYQGSKCIDDVWPELPAEPEQQASADSGSADGTPPLTAGGILAFSPDGVAEGNRNTELHKFALQALTAYGYDAYNLVVEKNQTYIPPLSEKEVQSVWNSARRYYDTTIRTNPNYTPPGQHSKEWEAERERRKAEYRQRMEEEYLDSVNSLTDADMPGWIKDQVDPTTGEIIPGWSGNADNGLQMIAAGQAAPGWKELQRFGQTPREQIPPFPMAALPEVQRNFAVAISRNYCTDPCMAGTAVLIAGAIPIQRAFVISPQKGWTESTSLFGLIVGEPSTGKSSVIEEVQKPFMEYEQRWNSVNEADIIRSEVSVQCAKDDYERARNKRKHGKDGTEKDVVQAALKVRQAEKDQTHKLVLLVSDATTEALVSEMGKQKGRIAILSDEGGPLDNMAGKYSTNAKADAKAICSGFTGKVPIRPLRQTRTTKTVYNPAITILLAIQPQVLEDVLGTEEFTRNGLTARMLYAYPEQPLKGVQGREIPADVRKAYKDYISELLSVPVPEDELDSTGEAFQAAQVITFDEEAAERWKKFSLEEWPYAHDSLEGISSCMIEWSGKYRGLVLRIAANFHAAKCGADAGVEPLKLDTLEDALTVAGYYWQTALATFDTYIESEGILDAKYIWHRLTESAIAKQNRWTDTRRISKHDVLRACRRFHNVQEMQRGLDVLTARGYIRIERTPGGGRPAENILLNPEALKKEKEEQNT